MKRISLPFVCFAVAFALVSTAHAQPLVRSQSEAAETIDLQVGETRLLRVSEEIIRISVADPDVADVQVVTQSQVLITAQRVGNTHLIMWGRSDEPLVLSVDVNRNLDQLRSQLAQLFPGENIEVGSAGELVVLSGEVSDLRLPARAAELAGLYSEQLANLIQVQGDQQVQLEVRFAEVSRSGLRRLGLNFLWTGGERGPYVGGQVPPSASTTDYHRQQQTIPGTGVAGIPLVGAPSFQDAFNLFFSTGLSEFPFSAILSILSREGLAKTLAEPTLVALSGQEASFQAGGEVPILTAQSLGNVSVQYREFGVQLDFVPTVLGGGTINLQLAVEVSEPDPAAGVVLGGFVVPGFRTRKSSTTVRLNDGQSFAIAGLLSDDVRSSVDKLPILGDIPILGALFRSTAFQREETELLVVVKAELVRPLDAHELPLLPGEDELTEPTDFELFLLGRIKPRKKDDDGRRDRAPAARESSARHMGPAGPIGFMRDR
jgi:pilus assembly protein CpaC